MLYRQNINAKKKIKPLNRTNSGTLCISTYPASDRNLEI